MASGRKWTCTSARPGSPREATYAGTSASVAGPGVVGCCGVVVIASQRRSGHRAVVAGGGSPRPRGACRTTCPSPRWDGQHGLDPRVVVEAVERGTDAALLEGEVGVHDRGQPVELTDETSAVAVVDRARGRVDEVLDAREDARHEVMVLDELVEHRTEVGSLGAQRGEESVVLAGVVGLQGPAEAETVLEDAGGRGLRVDRRRPRSDESVADHTNPRPKVVVHGGQLGGHRRHAVLVVMTWVAEA